MSYLGANFQKLTRFSGRGGRLPVPGPALVLVLVPLGPQLSSTMSAMWTAMTEDELCDARPREHDMICFWVAGSGAGCVWLDCILQREIPTRPYPWFVGTLYGRASRLL